MTVIPEQQLHDACRVLFGPQIEIVPQFFSYLQPAGVKAAYRKLAMETHPDRARLTGVDEAVLEERFKEVSSAYEQLFSYVQNPEQYVLAMPPRPSSRPVRPAAKPPEPTCHQFYTGQVPLRRILIGQFLYYSGAISMQQMWGAVVWQKIKRPRLGDIACKLDWLDTLDIKNIMNQRRRGELFGEFAVRAGLLDSYQLLVLLGRQRLLQPRIGDYFIERGILSPWKLDMTAQALKEHNRRHWFSRKSSFIPSGISVKKAGAGKQQGTAWPGY
jgi:hypothetical protein